MARPKSDKTLEKERNKLAVEAALDPAAQALDAEARRTRLKTLIILGKERGYLTYAEINDHLPDDVQETETIDNIIGMINDMGITVYEKAPDAESLLLSDSAVSNDEDAADEAAAALATVDAEFGRTTDPVRMYMREMGTVELLTREGEISIAKRIEEGLDTVRGSLAYYPATINHMLKAFELVKAGQSRLVDVIVGFIDPNAPDVIAQPQNPTKMEVVEAIPTSKLTFKLDFIKPFEGHNVTEFTLTPQVGGTTELRGRSFDAYIEDNWQKNSKLTLNLGLRYDHNTASISAAPRATQPKLPQRTARQSCCALPSGSRAAR